MDSTANFTHLVRRMQSLLNKLRSTKTSIQGRWSRVTHCSQKLWQPIAKAFEKTRKAAADLLLQARRSISKRCEATREWITGRYRDMRRLIPQLPTLSIPFVKTAVAICLLAGPWAYAVRGTGAPTLLVLGVFLGFLYTYLASWGPGAVFGIFAILFLGPILAAISPFVKTKEAFWVASAACGFFFALLFTMGIALTRPRRPKGRSRRLTSLASSYRVMLNFIFVPLQAINILLGGLPGAVRGEVGLIEGMAVYFAADVATTMLMMLLDLDLRPAMLFFQQLKPLLVAMWAGLLSFAIGYGFTILVFAGFYMALFRLDEKNFLKPQGIESLSVWDFIYFSVTTITTVGLSDLKPNNAMFWPQALVSIELIVGVFWVVVYFAVAMTLLQVHAREVLESLTTNISRRKSALLFREKRRKGRPVRRGPVDHAASS
jgi:ion channel